jgi:leucyl-tRNA synthetase
MIRKVTLDLERMAFNTAISAMMVFVNEAMKAAHEVSRSQVERFVQVLAPFAPHLAEELWKRLGNDPVRRPLAYEPWPGYDQALVVDAMIEIPVQVNGRLRGKALVPSGAPPEEILQAARAAAATHLAGKPLVKEIVVPGKLVNFVVRG